MTMPSIAHLIDFLAVIDCGSLSGAARKLGRAQAAVTYSIQSLERDLGVTLFDRSARPLMPTAEARSLMPMARRIVDGTTNLTSKALSLSQGVEGRVVLSVDTLTPMDALLPLVARFAAQFPLVELEVVVDAMTAPLQSVVEGSAVLAICGPAALRRQDIAAVPLTTIERCGVAAPSHPLAHLPGPVGAVEAARHRRIIMLNRDRIGTGVTTMTEPANAWRTSDIGAKREMIIAGLGWGNMPTHLIEKDLAAGTLVVIDFSPDVSARWSAPMQLYLTHSTTRPLGVAAQWLFDRAQEPAMNGGKALAQADRLEA